MKREYGIAAVLMVVALVIGLALGYAIWGGQASQIADLQAEIEQLTQENADLRSKLPYPIATGTEEAPAATAGAAPASAEKR